MKSIILLLALCGYSLAAPLDNGECGLTPNGADLERGRFIYECQNGRLVPKACITFDLKHISIGQTADTAHYRVKCSHNGDHMTLEAVACLHNGQEHALGQFQDEKNFYECQRSDDGLKVVNVGCIDDGKQIKLNDQTVKTDFVMVCNATVNSGSRLMPSACVKNGKQYKEGESFEVDNLWYTCTRVGRERLSLKAGGCINGGKRLNDGDRYTENEIIKECRIDNGQVSTQIVACVQRDETGAVVERRMGCTWTEGAEPQQFEMQCQADSTNQSAKKVMVRCNYKVNGGVHTIIPGCYHVIDGTAIGCQQVNGALKYQSFKGDNAEKDATSAGFHKC